MVNKHVLIINNEKYSDEAGWSGKIEAALTEIGETTSTIVHYSIVDKELVNSINPSHIIMTGRIGHHWEENEITDKYIPKLSIVRELSIPVLGICAGLQLLAIMHGGSIDKMVDSTENILEEGYIKHTKVRDHQFLSRLEDDFYCKQFHRDEVKELPEVFDLLASSEMCRVQVIAHKEKDLYGVQFHPEWFTEKYEDGKQILLNFLNT